MSNKPLVAIVSNSLTPYRLHLHRRIVRDLPEIRLASVFTHEESNSPWRAAPPEDIHPVQFGRGEPSSQQSRPRFALREWRKGGRICRWLAENAARAVVLFGYNDLGRLRIIRWCRARGIPCYLFGDSNIRGDRATGLKRWIKKAIVPRILRQCTAALYCGRLGREYFARYGVPHDRMFPFPYEPDYERIQSLPASMVAAVRDRYGLSPARHRLVFSGRLAAEKRVDLLLAAFAAIADDRPDWDLVLVGNGPLRSALEKQCPSGLANRVRWLGFLDDQDAISAIYQSCDVLVLPSDFEPWAVVITEALAANLAVVASDMVGAGADLVHDRVNGRVFPHGDGAALTECLRDVTAPEHTAAMRAASAAILTHWRRESDPVENLRNALRAAGVIGDARRA